MPSVTVRSPLGASPPMLDSQGDTSVSTPPMDPGGVPSDDSTTHSVVRINTFHSIMDTMTLV